MTSSRPADPPSRSIERAREWMLEAWPEQGGLDTAVRRLGVELSGTTLSPSRLSLALIPIYAGVDGVHFIWSCESPDQVDILRRPHGFLDQPEHLRSPLHQVFSTGNPLRVRLGHERSRFDFLADLASRGFTDYIAVPLRTQHSGRPVLTIATERPGGWSDEDIAGLMRLTTVLSLVVEVSEGRRLLDLASTDPLTGLPNRRAFDTAFRQAWSTCGRGALPLSILCIDVDHFKTFNDTYGYPAGDRCLARVAAAAAAAVHRPSDVVARMGGEEFAVLLPTCVYSGARVVAERERAAVEALAITNRGSPVSDRVTVSVGAVTIVPSPRVEREQVYGAADQALYRAKETGRNRVITEEIVLDP